ncbi:hypothetical protein BHM03_00061913 [Ensete ventricosum]|nr:hypothetical protein BHM03_00061913 [Ensete ventricosum]
MTCFRLCKSRGDYYLTACVGFKVSGSPSNNKGWKARYLFVSGMNWGFRLDWSAHPIDNVPSYLSEEESILVGRLKEILSFSCAIKEMIELWLVEAGLSPTYRGEVGKAKELNEDMERLVGCGGVRKGTSASAVGMGTIHAPVGCASSPSRQGDGAGNFSTLASTSRQEIDALKSGEGPEVVAAAEEHASKLEKELEKTKCERDEALQRLEISDKELNEARGDLSEAQRQLKEARVRAQKMDDELLKSMKDLESA